MKKIFLILIVLFFISSIFAFSLKEELRSFTGKATNIPATSTTTPQTEKPVEEIP